MGRDPLELAGDSLFIDKIKHRFEAADADLENWALAFALKKSCKGDSPSNNATGNKAADLLLEQDADAVTIASALLAPLLWQGLTDIDDIRENFRPEPKPTFHSQYRHLSLYPEQKYSCLTVFNKRCPPKAAFIHNFPLAGFGMRDHFL